MSKDKTPELEEVETTETQTDVTTEQPQKKKSKIKKFLITLFVLAVLTSAGAAGYVYGIPKAQQFYNDLMKDDGLGIEIPVVPQEDPAIPEQEIVVSAIQEDIPVFEEENTKTEPLPSQEVVPPVVEPVQIPVTNEMKPVEPVISEEPTIEPISSPDSKTVTEPVQKNTEEQSIQKPTHTIPSPTLLKVMELKEAFQNDGQCRPILEELMAAPDKTPQLDRALMDLLQICLDQPLSGQMKQSFFKVKRRAILRTFQHKNPAWTAYLQALPYMIADIHQKTPTGDEPLDILDRIQNAVSEDKPSVVLELIPTLPQNVQTVLFDVQQYAETEANLYKNLNKLMHAFFIKGGEND